MREIIFKARKHSFELFSGRNYSKKHSEGLDFEELREYRYGDSVKKIDYKSIAKFQKPFVKVFRDDKELNIVVVNFINDGLYFGSKRLKSEVMLELNALIGFSAVKGADKFTGMSISDRLESFVVSKHNKKIISFLDTFEFGFDKKFDIELALDLILNKIKKNSVVIMIGDFFYYSDKFRLIGSKFDAYAIILRDKVEENPEILRGVSLYSPRLNKQGTIFNINKYKSKLLENDSKIFKIFNKSNISFLKLYTFEDTLKIRRLFG